MRMIIAENLKKVYGGDFVSVDDLSFHIHKGEIVGFVEIGRASCRERV